MDPGYIATHVEEDQHHWWFLGRRAVLLSVLRAALPRGRLRVVEIGCGSGTFLPAAAEFGDVVGVEATTEFLEVARRRGFTVLRGSLPDQLPLEADSCDAALLFDVLEHLGDDRAALRAVRRILKPGGLLVCTVPAYQWLWSSHDEVLGHRRRYTTGGLRWVAKEAGLRPLRATYFNTLLALPIVGVRLLRRWRTPAFGPGTQRGHDLIRPAPWLNALLTRLFSLEAGLLRWINLPFGVSVLLVARRPSE
ncbi:MAG: class I SAM-dependent methyltransferase [Candidatus Rokubacteria bacterium]|nr:class I SAM-dependent methyltransferase [Candidatus Rokubacteria bacterium]